MARHLVRGRLAEALATRYLVDQGLLPIAANFRVRGGELDLVMADEATLVIVEVRSRMHDRFASAAATVDWRKQRKLIAAARCFLHRYRKYAAWPARFDVVEVSGDLDHPTIRWIRAAFSVDDAGIRR